MTMRLYRHQEQFRTSDRIYRGFVGGRSSGKTTAGATDLAIRASREPGLYGMFAPTYPMLQDSTLRTFRRVAGGLVTQEHASKSSLIMSSGSEIICRSLDDPDRARGPSLRGAWIDEAAEVSREAFDIVIGCLRYEGKQGWLSATFTPKGRGHWTYEVFATESPDTFLVSASSWNNPFNPGEYADTLARHYTSRFAAQELFGHFIDMSAGYCERHWFKIVRDAPRLERAGRYWDMAATPVTTDGNDPDYTAGAKLGLARGVWYILDMRRGRLSPLGNERLVQATASQDGRDCPVWMEEEGGSSGKSVIDHYARDVLLGYAFQGHRPTGDKVTRAMPLLAAAENGNVCLLEAEWNKAFLDEAESFGPDCRHDDQIDAAAGAMEMLASGYIDPSVEPEPAAAPVSEFERDELWSTVQT
jgi:predicted phage terminase large subunit-like protein